MSKQRIIKPAKGLRLPNIAELWENRELIYFLVWRDVKLRYKQTVLGILWAVLQPFMTMLIFSFFFGKMGRLPSDGVPYALFFYTALVPWTFFAGGINQAASSLVASSSLIKKIYFPRIIIPLCAVMSGVIDFIFAFIVLIAMMIFFGIPFGWQAILIPAIFLIALIAALGVGLWFSALNVLFRDIRHVIPFLVQAWFFSTPIIYSNKMFPQAWQTLLGLNPMAGVVVGFRSILLGTAPIPVAMIAVSLLSALVIFLSGLLYFSFMENRYEDLV